MQIIPYGWQAPRTSSDPLIEVSLLQTNVLLIPYRELLLHCKYKYLTVQGRALADLTDRHYALFANNQHPMQLEIYDDYNKMLRVAHSEDHQARIAATDARIQEVMAERS